MGDTHINKKQKHLGRRIAEAGNIFLMLFGAVGMVGILGAATMTIMKGPVRTMSIVTKRTIAENNMIATGKLALIAAASQSPNDCDSDGTIEPIPYGAAIAGLTGGGEIPASIGASTQDPWGMKYGYCTWDHGTTIDDAACGAGVGFEQGNATETGYVLAVISSGPDGVFQTSCNDDPATLLDKPSGSDDLIMGYTFADAGAIAAGLWNLKSGDPTIAEIEKKLEVSDGTDPQFQFDAALQLLKIGDGTTGTGEIPSVKTDFISELTGSANVEFLSPVTSASTIATTADISTTADMAANNMTVTTTLTAGNLATGGNLDVDGISTLGDAIGDLTDIKGYATIAGTLGVGGASTLGTGVGDDTTITGDAIVDVDLSVGGASTLGTGITDDTRITGDAIVDVDLSVGGTLTLNDLNVPGNTILGDAGTDTVTITGDTSITGAVDITGTLDMTSGVTLVADPRVTPTGDLDAVNLQSMTAAIVGATGANETDPYIVKPLGAAGKICLSTGTKVECTADLSATETDPQVDFITTAGRYCRSDGTAIDCDQTAADITGAGGGIDLDDITAATADNAINNAANNQTWNWQLTTGETGMAFGENVASAGGGVSDQFIVSASTLATSTAIPFYVENLGAGRSFQVDDGTTSFIIDTDGDVITGRDVTIGRDATVTGDLTIPDDGLFMATTNTAGHILVNDATNFNPVALSGDATIASDGTLTIGADTIEVTMLNSTTDPGVGEDEYCLTYEHATTNFEWVSCSVAAGAIAIDDLTDADTDYPNDNMFLGTGVGNGTDGLRNTGLGDGALAALNSGCVTGAPNWDCIDNTALGANSGLSLTTGSSNVLLGQDAGRLSTTAIQNTFVGESAGENNLTGEENSYFGYLAGFNGVGNHSTAIGSRALHENVAAGDTDNTAVGHYALYGVGGGVGTENTALGAQAGTGMNDGVQNTLIGAYAGDSITDGNANTFLGYLAGEATTTGSSNILIGSGIDASGAAADEELNIGDIFFGDIGTTSTDPKVGAYKYCDENLANCFVSTDVGGGSALSDITAATADNTINSGANNQTWNWQLTAAETGMAFGENTASSGGGASDQFIISASTLATSTAIPFYVENLGAGRSFQVDDGATSFIIDTDGDVITGRDVTIGRDATVTGDLTIPDDGLFMATTNTAGHILVNDATNFNPVALSGDATIAADGTFTIGADTIEVTMLNSTTDPGVGEDEFCLTYEHGTTNFEWVDCATAIGAIAIDDLTDAQTDYVTNDNMFLGLNAGPASTDGAGNVALGESALAGLATTGNCTGGSGTECDANTAIGFETLIANTIGDWNTAIGYKTLESNTTGGKNTGVGKNVLRANTTGGSNIAVGAQTLNSNTTGNSNVAMGRNALEDSVLSSNNAAFGDEALRYFTPGAVNGYNVAIGPKALSGASGLSTGVQNTAIGALAGTAITTGDDNVFMGYNAGVAHTTASGNIMIGKDAGLALTTQTSNTFVGNTAGADPLNTGSENTFIGDGAGNKNTTGEDNTYVGTWAGVASTTGFHNVFLGYDTGASNTTGNKNVFLGGDAGFLNTEGFENTFIGDSAGNATTTGDRNIIIGSGTDASSATADDELNIGDKITGGLLAAGVLTVEGTSALVLPIGTDAQRPAAEAGLIRYNSETSTDVIEYYDAEGTTWRTLLSSGGAIGDIDDLGDADTDYPNDNMFLGTGVGNGTDGIDNTGLGSGALAAMNSGCVTGAPNYDCTGNTAFGMDSGAALTTGSRNIMMGRDAGLSLTTGSDNTLIGDSAGQSLTTQDGSTIIGYRAGEDTTATNNTYIGNQAGQKNLTGDKNTYVGHFAGDASLGSDNTYLGYLAGGSLGAGSGLGDNNTFIGKYAGRNYDGADNNTFLGEYTGYSVSSGDDNILIGQGAGYDVAGAGVGALTTGSRNILIGRDILTTAVGANDELNIGDKITGDMTAAGVLTIEGTSALVLPIGTDAQRPAAEAGLLRYNSEASTDVIEYYDAEGTTWRTLLHSGGAIGDIDDLGDAAANYTSSNIFMGQNAGASITSGENNLFIGEDAGRDMATGGESVILGTLAGRDATNSQNVYIGHLAGYDESTAVANSGIRNVFVGEASGYQNETGDWNVFVGAWAGLNNLSGDSNTFVGDWAGQSNTTGGANTFIGREAGDDNDTGSNNTYLGFRAGQNGVTVGGVNIPQNNTFVGSNAGLNLATGEENTIMGYQAGENIADGNSNVFMGLQAGRRMVSSSNVALGNFALYGGDATPANNTGAQNVALGYSTGSTITSGSDNILIGYDIEPTAATAANELNIGDKITGSIVTAGVLTIEGTSALVLPIGTDAQRPAAEAGLIRYNSEASTDVIEYYDAEGTTWRTLLSSGGAIGDIDDLGDGATDYAKQNLFLGETAGADGAATGTSNTAVGKNAGRVLSTGTSNTIMGADAGYNLTTGDSNTLIGVSAGSVTSDGIENVAIGDQAGQWLDDGADNNTLIGTKAGQSLTGNSLTGDANTALGSRAGRELTTGTENVFVGVDAGNGNTTGIENVAIGTGAAYTAATASRNVSIGHDAGTGATNAAVDNVIIGHNAGDAALTSTQNVIIGKDSGTALTSGGDNVLLGFNAGAAMTTGDNAVMIGSGAGDVNTASWSVFVGKDAGGANTSGQWNTFVGQEAGNANIAAANNAYFGASAGLSATGGSNAFFGALAGKSSVGGADNSFFGSFAGENNGAGIENTYLGGAAGQNASGSRNVAVGMNTYNIAGATGDDNILIGHNIEPPLNTTSDYLNIGNLIYGDLANNEVFLDAPAAAAPDGDLANGQLTFWVDAANDEIELKAKDSAGDVINVTVGSGGGATEINDLTDAYANYTSNNVFLGNNAGVATTAGIQNVALGVDALMSLDTVCAGAAECDNNVAIGHRAGRNMTLGRYNVLLGRDAGYFIETGTNNTYVGESSGEKNVGGNFNVAVGRWAAFENLGNNATAVGFEAMKNFNVGGDTHNVALGYNALLGGAGASGTNNTALGALSGAAITTGTDNVFMGYNTGAAMTTGDGAVLIGANAGLVNTASYSIYIGDDAGFSSTSALNNTFVGAAAGYSAVTGGNNSYFGINSGATETGTHNSFFGANAGGLSVGGLDNSFFGSEAGENSGAGDYNTYIGKMAGENASGDDNVALGAYAYNGAARTGSRNILIGESVGVPLAATSDYLNIGNLIYGDLANNEVFLDAPAAAAPDGDLANGQVTFWVDAANDEIELKAKDSAGDLINVTVGSGSGLWTAGAGDDIYYNTGVHHVGIGTTNPTTELDLLGDLLIRGSYTGTSSVPSAGSDSQLYFDVQSSSFRAGQATAAQWDDANVGNYSIGIGYNATASGSGSVAMGISTIASGPQSVAFGDQTSALGDESFAMGEQAVANSTQSFAMGNSTTSATGNNSFAFGAGVDTNGVGAVAMGSGSQATGNYSVALGQNTTAGGGANTFAVGSSTTASGTAAVAMGSGSQATGNYSVALGQNGTATNAYTISMGLSADATARSAIAMGENTTAGGQYSVAMGNGTTASGNYGFAMGSGTTDAVGLYSFALGQDVVTAGDYSLGFGREVQTTATGDYSVAFGLSNPAGVAPQISGANSFAIFMGDQSGYDLTTANRMALVGGDFLIDDDGTAGSQGCIRYVEGSGLEYSDDCSTFATFASLGGAIAIDDLTDAITDYTTEDNIFMGNLAGTAGTQGQHNVALGVNALTALDAVCGATDCDRNTAIGYNALVGVTSGYQNTAIGADAGNLVTSGNSNVFIGYKTGRDSTGSTNTFIGKSAGEQTTADGNTYVGYQAGKDRTTGNANTAIGSGSGQGISGGANVFIGNDSGKITTGNNNVFLGEGAGELATTGDDNILIGNTVEKSSLTASDELNIGNLIYGDLANGYVGIGTNAPTGALTINHPATADIELFSIQNNGSTTGGVKAFYDNGAGDMWMEVDTRNTWFGGVNPSDWPSIRVGVLPLTTATHGVVIQANSGQLVTGDLLGIRSDGQVNDDSADLFVVRGTGLVGIGDPTPDHLLDVAGNIGLDASSYINFGDTDGTTGYGIRDNAGAIECKDSGGSWAACAGGGGVTEIDDLSDGVTDYTTDYNIFMGDGAGAAIAVGGQFNTVLGISSGDNITTGDQNTFMGTNAGGNVITSGQNTFLGNNAGRYNSTGARNTYVGNAAGDSNNTDFGTGSDNALIGSSAGAAITSGAQNTVLGSNAGVALTTGDDNVLLGYNAGTAMTTGSEAVLIGSNAGAANTASWNVFVGSNAGVVNTSGSSNTFMGVGAGSSNITGGDNAYFGANAGSLDTGISNAYFGALAGKSSTTGNDNAFFGSFAGENSGDGDENTYLGMSAGHISTGHYNVAIGAYAGSLATTGDNNILIGKGAQKSVITASSELNIGDKITGSLTTAGVITVEGTSGLVLPIGTDAQRPAAEAGLIRYNSEASTDVLEYYDAEGTTWRTLLHSGGAIGDIDDLGDAITDYANDSMYLGQSSGTSASGTGNVFLGENSGNSGTNTGANNVFVGSWAGNLNTAGEQNVSIGSSAGEKNLAGDWNVYIGYLAGQENTGGTGNTYVGRAVGWTGTGGGNNTLIGSNAAGGAVNTGGDNVFVGQNAGYLLTSGGSNTVIGQLAGDANITTGSGNILLGNNVDVSAAGVSDELNIGNLIYGDLSAKEIFLPAPATAVADGDLAVNQATIYLVEGTDDIVIKAKESGGTVLTKTLGGGGASAIDDLSDADTDYPNDNMFLGSGAGAAVTSGTGNTVLGEIAAAELTTGIENTHIGHGAGGYHHATNAASYNTYLGYQAGRGVTGVTEGQANVAIGHRAFHDVTTGSNNTIMGVDAGANITSGSHNTLIGKQAGQVITTINASVFVGHQSGKLVTSGQANVGLGAWTLDTNSTGWRNTAIGHGALGDVTTSDNTALGARAGSDISTGEHNTLIGSGAGYNEAGGGTGALTTGSRNILIGKDVITSAVGADDELNIGDLIYGDLANNYVGIGTNAPDEALHIASDTETSVKIATFNDTNFLNPRVVGERHRGTSAAPTIVADGDTVFELTMKAYDGGSARHVAYIQAEMDGTPTGTSLPGQLEFHTQPVGSNGQLEGTLPELIIRATGHVGVSENSPRSQLTVGGDTTDRGTFGIENEDTDVQNAEVLGIIDFRSNESSSSAPLPGTAGQIDEDAVVRIHAEASGQHTGGDWPSDLVFSTVDSSDNQLAERMRLDGNGLVTIPGDLTVTGTCTGCGGGASALDDLSDAVTDWASGGGSVNNMFIGEGAGNDTGKTLSDNNIGIGFGALNALPNNANSARNVALGNDAGLTLGQAADNTFLGGESGQDVTTGDSNTMVGSKAGQYATTTLENVFVGFSAGQGDGSTAPTGAGNVAVGAYALDALTTGTDNVAIGRNAGGAQKTGDNAVMIGVDAGLLNTVDYNVFIGWKAGDANTTGTQLTAVGAGAGSSTATVSDSVYVGTNAGTSATGRSNVYVGSNAGKDGTNGVKNTYIGKAAGLIATGDENVFIGQNTADSATSGNLNIIIGSGQEKSSATAANELNIGGTLYGDLSNDLIGIGQVPATGVELDVLGDIEYTGTITDVSDRRLKKDIVPLSKKGSILDKIASVDTYSFKMKDDKEDKTEFGVMAQELEEIFPELVRTAEDEMGTKSVNYVGLIAPMIEASKELKAENDTLRAELDEMKKAIDSIGAKVGHFSNDNQPSMAAWSPLMTLGMFGGLGFIGGLGLLLVVTRKSKNKAA